MVQIYLLLFVLQAGEGMGTYMTKKMEFFICWNTMQIIKIKQLFKYHKSGMQMALLKKIYDSYLGYHTERIENAYENIDSLLNTGKHAW